jgi:PucR family transcriptional regulator, purine catabolism regulatory protein
VTLTVRDILRFDVFQQAEAEVVAGAAGLDRRVRWVHLSDVPDIASLLQGGELLLTTGMGLSSEDALQRRYIRELAEVGVAGLVIGVRRTSRQIPEALIRESDARQVPLIVFQQEVRYVEITEAVHSTIINRQYQMLERADMVARDFAQLALSGAGTGRIVNRLAEIVRNPVILEDRAHQVVEYATHMGTVDTLLRAWEAHSRSNHDWDTKSPVSVVEGPNRCAWMPIMVREEVWYRVHVMEQDTILDDVDLLSIDRAGWIIGFTLLADKDTREAAHHARGALIADILHGRFGSSEEVLRRARALGTDFHDRKLVVLNVEPREKSGPQASRSSTQRNPSYGCEPMVNEIRRAISRASCVGLLTMDGQRVVAIVGVLASDSISTRINEIVHDASQHIRHNAELIEIAAGASSEIGIESLQRGLNEASEALRCEVASTSSLRVTHFADLGLQRLLLRLREGNDLAHFVETELGPLLEHDAAHAVPLVQTLRSYLEAGGNKSTAAKALHVERKSLYHRLDRIHSLLGRDIDDPEVWARLFVALSGLDLLQHKMPTIGV